MADMAQWGAILGGALLLTGGAVYLWCRRTLDITRAQLGARQAELGVLRERLHEADARCQAGEQAYAELQAVYQDLQQRFVESQTRQHEREQQHAREQQWVLESKQQLKAEFENLANQFLEQKGKSFAADSERHLLGLLQPFREEVKGFRDKVEHLHHQETMQRASLKTELTQLQRLNRDITDQAAALTEALKGQKKVQGNWGELMLENVLESAGLRLGVDYDRERSFTTEQGRRRPDAVIYLPQQRHLVIDAKTSLVAYLEYVNGEDEASCQRALTAHAKAVSERIEELADKQYFDLPGLNSPEVVVMFIPVESAYIAALRHDDGLYQRAIERNVLVATPTTLMTSLKIVSQLWRFENQSRHSAELARRAERFHSKLASFLESMEEVGKKLDGARAGYDRAMGQLANGKGNLIHQATDFKELGVAVKKELPAAMVERARLEMGTVKATPSVDRRD